MSRMILSTHRSDIAAESAQRHEDGTARFCVPAAPDDPAWAHAVEQESDHGVQSEIRVFLDEQLEAGDLVLDLAPGFGFVALSAATAPNGAATVLVAEPDAPRLALLEDAATAAGVRLGGLSSTQWESLSAVIATQLPANGRLFVHLATHHIAAACRGVAALPQPSPLLALCVSPSDAPTEWAPIARALAEAGLRACGLVANDEGAMLVPLAEAPLGAFFALPDALFSTDEASALPETTPAFEEIFPTIRPVSWKAAKTGFSLIGPHSRTGYGVTGANLLRALQEKGVPVAFFPIGGVDPTLTANPLLPVALQAQDNFPVDAPSVRLAQQFDLALHAGRGARVAFTIFETDVFTSRERHHLRMQDAVLVCSPWAREVCVANGLAPSTVHVVPLGVDREIYHPDVVPRQRWQADETVFMQVGKLESRKGQLDLLRAFEAAFTPRDRVRLVFICHNPFLRKDQFEAALAPFRTSVMARHITLHLTELATSRDVAAMMAAADCGVFPSRAEGWNLEALEMLAMGKALIVSNATAHTAFLTSDNARLIEMGPPERLAGGQHPGSWPSWTSAQHEQLVHHLRAVHADRRAGAGMRNDAGIETAMRHSWAASADAVLKALETVY
jgi:glycosyltransferase involved in cell wall biosynthesis